ncbi:MAG: tyrosine--tRNA ligase [Fimbriimonadaceae bacterium]
MTIDDQLAVLRRGTTEIISEEDLRTKLKSGKPLRVKLGVDPTAAHVTLGWAVVLRKLRDFQRFGHTACLVIGDFTAQIGDPSGKSKTRPQLTREEVQSNVEAVSQQFYKILDPERTEISFNADWLGKMGFDDVIRLASRMTVARILERDDFSKRLAEQRPISMHELLYPLCQGFDSVALRADIELGGTDQKFNNLVGRTLMAQYGMEPQVVMLCPLLVGTDGVEKMSQSLGNYISVVDAPNDMYGKAMSIPDAVMENYFELATDVPMDEVRSLIAGCDSGEINPRDVKRRLARELVELYHSAAEAEAADEHFLKTFSRREQPTDAEPGVIPADMVVDGQVPLANLIVALGLEESTGRARKLVESGAVSIDGDKVTDPRARLAVADVEGRVLRVGKHRFRKLTRG